MTSIQLCNSFWKDTEAQVLSHQNLIDKLQVFCGRWCPERTHLAPFLATQYVGRETELDASLRSLYNHSLFFDSEIDTLTKTGNLSPRLPSRGEALRPLEQAAALAAFYGLGEHFVSAVCAQEKRAYCRRRYAWGRDYNPIDSASLAEAEEQAVEQSVLFEVLAAIFPDAFLNALSDPAQRVAFATKRLAAFLAFHDAEGGCHAAARYMKAHHYTKNGDYSDTKSSKHVNISHDSASCNTRDDGEAAYSALGDALLQHYSPLLAKHEALALGLEEFDACESTSSSNSEAAVTVETTGGGPDEGSRKRRVKSALREWATAYGLRHKIRYPTRSRRPRRNVAVHAQCVSFASLRGEAGVQTRALPTAPIGPFAVGRSCRLYGTFPTVPMAATARGVEKGPKPLLPNPAVALDADSCAKCAVLAARLAQEEAAHQHFNRSALSEVERRFGDEAARLARSERVIKEGIERSCVECVELRERVQRLQLQLRESYDKHRELMTQLSKYKSEPHYQRLRMGDNTSFSQVAFPFLLGAENSVELQKPRRSVACMTTLMGKHLDTMRANMILDAL